MKHRAYRGKPTAAASVSVSVLILLLGLVLGAASRWADIQSVFWGDLTSHIALWILLASVTALASRSPAKAALNVLLLLGGMVAAYYAVWGLTGGGWSRNYLLGWSAAVLLSPIPGWLVWYARGEGQWAWLISIGVVAAQVAASVLLYDRLNLIDLIVTVLTAVLLFWNKMRAIRRPRRRRYGR